MTAALTGIREAESAVEAKVRAGMEIPDFIRELLDSDQVRTLD